MQGPSLIKSVPFFSLDSLCNPIFSKPLFFSPQATLTSTPTLPIHHITTFSTIKSSRVFSFLPPCMCFQFQPRCSVHHRLILFSWTCPNSSKSPWQTSRGQSSRDASRYNRVSDGWVFHASAQTHSGNFPHIAAPGQASKPVDEVAKA